MKEGSKQDETQFGTKNGAFLSIWGGGGACCGGSLALNDDCLGWDSKV